MAKRDGESSPSTSGSPRKSPRHRQRISSNTEARPNAASSLTYFVIIKWIVFALAISLGSVFLLDVIKTVIVSFTKNIAKESNNNLVEKDASQFSPEEAGKPDVKIPIPELEDNLDNNNRNTEKINESEASKELSKFLEHCVTKRGKSLNKELKQWLIENQLESYWSHLLELGVVTLVSVVQLDHLTQQVHKPTGLPNLQPNSDSFHRSLSIFTLPGQDRERLKRAASILRQRLILRLWLDDQGLLDYAAKFTSLGINSIEDIYWFEDVDKLQQSIGDKIVPMWTIARQSLPRSGLAELEGLKNNLWNRLVQLDQQSIWNTWGTMLLVTLSISGFGAIASYFPQMLDCKQAILQYVSGKFSLASNCKVEFDWEDNAAVGQAVSMKLKFFQRGGRPFPICDKDNLLVEVKKDAQKVAVITEYGGKDPSDANLVVVKFSVRKSGQYSIHVLAENNHVKGSPFTKTFLPGPIDPSKTLFLRQTSTVVCCTGSPHKLCIEPRDSYGNCCRIQDYELELFKFSARAVDDNDESNHPVQNFSVQFAHDFTPPNSTIVSTSNILDCGRVILTIRVQESGVYYGTLLYDGQPVQNGCFEILSLTSTEANAVQKNVVAKSPNVYYEGKVLAIGNEIPSKLRKVYVSVTTKQLVIKEYFLKLLPIRVATFRLSPNTKLQFLGLNNQIGAPTIVVDDGSQPAVKLALKDAKVIVATFTHFLLRNIGGSETFQDKQEYFFKELRERTRKYPRDKLTIKIDRDNLIESTWKATKGLSSHEWCRNFDISFVGEQGIDWGGLRREWFEKICTRLFESGNPVGMFASFPESRLVHPNPNTKWKCKHYEMAGRIVGKCLFESSLGSNYRQLVKAKFTRSFLAQLIGLRVNYKYFEQDDPELYLRKVKFILENDVDGMELTFSEEEYDPMGRLIKTVDLIPDGSKITVTNQNKKDYLNSLAQYRLATKIKYEIEAFLKGLNEIVPDELLTIFDENELELLMCGTSEYSVTELREHHMVCGGSGDMRKVLDWFWTAVGNMTEEEKARLLQFTTGCSLLPPGGFKELSPLFQISLSPQFGNLPTAHTCFNQLCLPDYDSYENFEKSLRIAVNEGSEGFGLI